ncbi:MAG: DegT/DnrJ/EryC1/StrS family aminotransferase [Sphingobacteriales bacterium]|nr:MAG: DegT/DnrJ/EryC1/StrS family aminotransferase [Sphingobacteriales bacterium]
MCIAGSSFGLQFEQELAAHIQAKYVIACGNGTDALQIALMALQLKPGDEVILPAFTYVAAGEAIALLGMVPVFVDVDPETFNIDVSQIERSINSRTRAIIPVHLFGQCCDMENLLIIAKKHGIAVLEDAAQAIGASYRFSDGTVKQAGTMGTIGTTSFFPSKNLGCFGDGGAVFTNDDELAKRIRMIGSHGQARQYYHEIVGVNSRLDTLQAAILRVKLTRLNEYSVARNCVAVRYDMAFAGDSRYIIPIRDARCSHVFNQYTLRVSKIDRDDLKAYLEKKGISSMVYYPLPLHKQHAYLNYAHDDEALRNSISICDQVISLPIHTEMKTEVQDYIIQTILAY